VHSPKANVLRYLIISSVVLMAACASPAPPTMTPRPTIPPREQPTPLPTSVFLGELDSGEPIEVSLPGGSFVELSLTLDQPTRIDLSVTPLSDDSDGNPLDPVAEILDEDFNRVAYSDDTRENTGEQENLNVPTIREQMAAGVYIVRLNSFNGAQDGDVRVLLETVTNNDQE